MKKYSIIALVLLLAFSLCACRFGSNNDSTGDSGMQQPTDTMPSPTIIDPTMPDPTIDTNIPDPNVDKDHMMDETGNGQDQGDAGSNGPMGDGAMGDGTANGEGNDPLSRIRRQMR